MFFLNFTHEFQFVSKRCTPESCIHHFQTKQISHNFSAHVSYIFPVNKHTPTVGFATKTQLSPIQTPFTIPYLYILMTNPKGCDKHNSKPQLSRIVPFRAVHSRGRQEIRCFRGFWSPYFVRKSRQRSTAWKIQRVNRVRNWAIYDDIYIYTYI